MSELTNSDPPEIIRKIALNVSKYGVFPGPYFPAFGLNAKRYEVSLRIQSKCGKIRTRKNSVFGHLPRSETIVFLIMLGGIDVS